MKPRIIALAGAGALLSVLISPAASTAAPAPAPAIVGAQKSCTLPTAGRTFRTARPGQEDLNAFRLEKAVAGLSSRSRLSVQVFRNNCLVATGPLNPLTDQVHNNLWSVTKSVVSMLTGIAIGDGKLALDDPIIKYLPSGSGWGDALHTNIRIWQLLTQTSGLSQAILSEAGTLGLDQSLPEEALAQNFKYDPGTKFQYSQLGPALLAYVVSRAVGEDLGTYAQQRLFGPIGIRAGSYFWLRDRSGNPYGYSNLFMTPPQLARLGLLMSNDGNWNGQQLIPASYVHQVSEPTPTNGCYGFLFWTNAGTTCTGADIPDAQTLDRRAIPSAPADAYEMNGTGGQLAVMIPSLHMTVVTTGYFGSLSLDPPVLLGAAPDEMQWTFFRDLMKAVEDTSVPDPGPYQEDPIDLHFDPFNYADYGVLARDMVTTPSCNVVYCNGSIPTKGLLENVQNLPGML